MKPETESELAAELDQAVHLVRTAHGLLARTETEPLENSETCLRAAIRSLAGVHTNLSTSGTPQPASLAPRIIELRRELEGAQVLLRHAAQFCEGLRQLSGSWTAGYTSRGGSAHLESSRRLAVEA